MTNENYDHVLNVNLNLCSRHTCWPQPEDREPNLKMDKDWNKITERILNLTLDIIYLLTEEDYIVVKKSGEHEIPIRTQILITVPPPHSLIHDRDNDQKILELTNKIIQLLTGEEGEYLEGHKDVMMQNNQPLTSLDASKTGPNLGRLRAPCSLNILDVPQNNQAAIYCNVYTQRLSRYGINMTESTSCEGNSTDTDIYTPTDHTQYTSTDIKEESVSCDGGNLTDTDIYTPTDHTQYTSIHIKQESVSCDGGNLTDTDIYTPTDHTQYTSTDIKEESVSCDGGNLTDTDIYTPTDHTQYTSTDIKEESVSCDGGNLTDSDIYTPTEHTQYTSTHIKEESVSCDGGNLTDSDIYTPTDHTQYTSTDIEEIGKLSYDNRNRNANHIQIQKTAEENISVKFVCFDCDMCFLLMSDLVSHQGIHIAEKLFPPAKPPVIYKLLRCPECDRTFYNKSSLVLHSKSHRKKISQSAPVSPCPKGSRSIIENETFKCFKCGKRFLGKLWLNTHLRGHTGERPYSCNVCSQSFMRACDLAKHCKRRHR
ncbi:uncharacterized protein LOC142160115 [Mixophyes fleayi]|uniref:uncharacterized protein LOC142160115 n=1 Tax=Mixophyes fleayi TaxID=3061075 RepID=UPI003F4D9E88